MGKKEINPLSYKVGGLLYIPAFQSGAGEKIVNKKIPALSSVAFCLEDAVQDAAVLAAERELYKTLRFIYSNKKEDLPLLFIRVRSFEQMERVEETLDEAREIITGYIFPKFDLRNAEDYLKTTEKISRFRQNPIYIMPILESKPIADLKTRVHTLTELRAMLDNAFKYVLNLRVGGNDFSNIYGLRRNAAQTIYDVGVVRDILMNILNVFADNYVVSGVAWNYFGAFQNEPWATGLRRELTLDRLNGFIGKTAIHPSQLPIIKESLSVTAEDYEDACSILNWSEGVTGVKKSVSGSRMNELKCHGKWAKRIKLLGDMYGIRKAEA